MLSATKKPILLALLIVLGSIAGCIGNDEEKTELETLTVAFEVKDDYEIKTKSRQKTLDGKKYLKLDKKNLRTSLSIPAKIFPFTTDINIYHYTGGVQFYFLKKYLLVAGGELSFGYKNNQKQIANFADPVEYGCSSHI